MGSRYRLCWEDDSSLPWRVEGWAWGHRRGSATLVIATPIRAGRKAFPIAIAIEIEIVIVAG